jgi:putative transposase
LLSIGAGARSRDRGSQSKDYRDYRDYPDQWEIQLGRSGCFHLNLSRIANNCAIWYRFMGPNSRRQARRLRGSPLSMRPEWGAACTKISGRAYRLWRLAKLQVPRKRGRKRVAASRPRPQAPAAANQVWSYDFVFDHCANGERLKCLTVTDEFTKEGLAIDVGARIHSSRVIEVLSRLVSERGAPAFLRSDNGPEFVSRALLSWITEQGIRTALIDPGKPWQNGVGESFNGKFRDECLSLEWFRSRPEAKVVIETWWRHYNDVRPHSSLGYLTPAAFAAPTARPAPRDATGRDAALSGAFAPRPVASPPQQGQQHAGAALSS